uniref:Uncharacterized protein n=1 Tax=Rhizophora mucronata TaxID=61149 RepID=A0A2P2NJT7_RHIMU
MHVKVLNYLIMEVGKGTKSTQVAIQEQSL